MSHLRPLGSECSSVLSQAPLRLLMAAGAFDRGRFRLTGHCFEQSKLSLSESPVALPKAIKNPVEIQGMKNANVSIISIFTPLSFISPFFLCWKLCESREPGAAQTFVKFCFN